MRWLLLLLVALIGCGTPGPLPATTPFDADPELRAAYLREYQNGYVMALRKQTVCVAQGTGALFEARAAGLVAGHAAGSKRPKK